MVVRVRGARGTPADSDIDIGLLLTDPRTTALDVYEMLGDLASRLEAVTAPRRVDVVLLEHQGVVFAHDALIDGRLLLEQDRERRIDFEATTAVRAFDFRPTLELSRHGQVEAFRRRLRDLRG